MKTRRRKPKKASRKYSIGRYAEEPKPKIESWYKADNKLKFMVNIG